MEYDLLVFEFRMLSEDRENFERALSAFTEAYLVNAQCTYARVHPNAHEQQLMLETIPSISRSIH